MTGPLDYIQTPIGMSMPEATGFTRLRAKRKPSAYNPDRGVEDWDDPDRLDFTGFIATINSSVMPDQNREETVSTSVITVPDPLIDIRKGDRITQTDDAERTWEVIGVPGRDMHPWTGWRPTTEINVTEWRG